MPFFDVVSEIDAHELSNAVDQTKREIDNRFDFKGTDARVEQDGYTLTIIAQAEFQVKQVLEILRLRLAKRGVDIACLEVGEISISIHEAKQKVVVRTGLEQEFARKIVKFIKDTRLKLTAQIQDKQVRVTGKKRDELQEAITALRGADIGMPLQFTNFRD